MAAASFGRSSFINVLLGGGRFQLPQIKDRHNMCVSVVTMPFTVIFRDNVIADTSRFTRDQSVPNP